MKFREIFQYFLLPYRKMHIFIHHVQKQQCCALKLDSSSRHKPNIFYKSFFLTRVEIVSQVLFICGMGRNKGTKSKRYGNRTNKIAIFFIDSIDSILICTVDYQTPAGNVKKVYYWSGMMVAYETSYQLRRNIFLKITN